MAENNTNNVAEELVKNAMEVANEAAPETFKITASPAELMTAGALLGTGAIGVVGLGYLTYRGVKWSVGKVKDFFAKRKEAKAEASDTNEEADE